MWGSGWVATHFSYWYNWDHIVELMVEEIRYALTGKWKLFLIKKTKALDISSGITSNTSCN